MRFEFGDTIVQQGDPADAYFVIADGRARVLTVGTDGNEVPLDVLSPGDAFGEIALVEQSPRLATVRASTPLEVWRLDRSVFLALIRVHPSIREALGVDVGALTRGNFLRLHPAFATLPRHDLGELVGSMQEIRLAAGEETRETATGIYIVSAGHVAAIGDAGQMLYRMHTGDVASTHNSERSQAVTLRAAENETRVLLLRQDVMDRLVRTHPEVLRRLHERMALVKRRRRGDPTSALEGAHHVASSDEELLAVIAEDDTTKPDVVFRRSRWRRRRRYADVRQVDAMDCGAACVATLCRQFGYNVSLPAIRAAVGTGLDGTSLRGIVRGGAEIGVEFRAVKSSVDRLPSMPKPAILHWGGNHWVVLHELRKGRAVLADPATGLRTVPLTQLSREWTGYAATATPTEQLAAAPRGGVRLGWLLPFVRPHYGMLTLAVVLALVATGLQMALPVFTQVIIDELLQHRGAVYTSVVVGIIFLALFGAVGVTIVQRRILARIAVVIDGRALDYLAERLLLLPVGYFQVRRTADIQRRLEGMREIRTVLVEDGVSSVTAGFQLVVAFVVMALYSWIVALLFLAVMPLYGMLMRYSSRRLRPALESLEEAFGRYQSKQLELDSGHRGGEGIRRRGRLSPNAVTSVRRVAGAAVPARPDGTRVPGVGDARIAGPRDLVPVGDRVSGGSRCADHRSTGRD